MSDVKQETHTIEHLDFEAELACEHSQHSTGRFGHDGYAWALVERFHTCSGRPVPKRYLICETGWLNTRRTRCAYCSFTGTRDMFIRLVEIL